MQWKKKKKSAVRPAKRLRLVNYRPRPPATAEEVAAECARIVEAYHEGRAPCGLVRLSGIDWRVLKVVADSSGIRALLLADRVIAQGKYHEVQVEVTWEHCGLRRWLNGPFLVSLGEPLISRAIQVTVLNRPNPTCGTAGGNNTLDRFFLLDIEETVEHLLGKKDVPWKEYDDRELALGDAPDEQGLMLAETEKGGVEWWWLRSRGWCGDRAAYVSSGTIGRLISGGDYVCVSAAGVRPAFWLAL